MTRDTELYYCKLGARVVKLRLEGWTWAAIYRQFHDMPASRVRKALTVYAMVVREMAVSR